MRHAIVLILSGPLLAPLAALHAERNLLELPRFGKHHVGSFQALENSVR